MMSSALKLVFMGTPDFSVPALAALVAAGHDVCAVYTQPPRPAGRGHQLTKSPVQLYAEERGLATYHPKSLRNAEAQAEFDALGADLAVVVAYGLILPAQILAAPRLGCVNIHASLLPRWRGAAPIHRALLAGDSETGITIMQMDEGLDTGPMLAIERTPIDADDTAQSLHDRLAAIGAGLIVRTVAALAAGNLATQPQPETGVTYAHKLSRADSPIDWQQPAAMLARQVRALTPWPGCFFMCGDEQIKILAAEIVALPAVTPVQPGMLCDHDGTIMCGDGVGLRLIRAQRPNRPPVSGRDLVNGARWPIGMVVA